MPRFVFATDSLKGTLGSREAALLLEAAARRHFPGCECSMLEIADGGEGTVDAVVSSIGGRRVDVEATGPYGDPVQASYAVLPDGSAVLEAAAASGITLSNLRDPLAATSRGTGELVAHALDNGCSVLRLGLGGSATNDGGMGLLSALGVVFKDADGSVLSGTGADLARVASVDTRGMHPGLANASIILMGDVDNPLLGPDGATFTFGRQKGASDENLVELESGMTNYASCVSYALGFDRSGAPGAGAAGGMGFACMAFLGASMHSGVECVLELAKFDDLIAQADLVVTGEGHADAQTGRGKVMAGVAAHAGRANVPVVAVVGGMDARFDGAGLGISAVVPCVPDIMSGPEAMADALVNYELAADRLFSLLSLGSSSCADA